jgi:uncharacterized protein (TIGR02145 family)
MLGESKIIDRDDPYLKYANGVVYDSKTGLEWIAGPGRSLSWDEAKEWAKDLEMDGSGWRIPTRKELETLYQEGKGKRNMTRLLETAAWWVWSAEHDDGLSSSLFDFSRGSRDWQSRTPRAYAVRARK